jgi:hypothetical protein
MLGADRVSGRQLGADYIGTDRFHFRCWSIPPEGFPPWWPGRNVQSQPSG